MHILLLTLLVLTVFVCPALCIGKIAARLGRNGLGFGLLALLPLGPLVALGLLALDTGRRGTARALG